MSMKSTWAYAYSRCAGWFACRGWTAKILVCLLVAGCAQDSVYVQSWHETRKLVDEGKTLVLLRLVVTQHDRQGNPFDTPWTLGQFELGLAKIDAGETMKRIIAYSPSLLDKRRGWFYIVVAPGRYQLWIVPPIASFKIFETDAYRPMPDAYLDVPPDVSVIYGGSLYLACSAQTGLWGSLTVEQCDESLLIRNEEKEARQIVKRLAPRSAPILVRLGHTYRKDFRDLRGQATKHIDLTALGPIRWIRPDWRQRALERVGVTPNAVERSLWGFGGISTILYLLYLPVGIVVGELWGAADEGDASACLDRWQATLHMLNLQQEWIGTIRAALKTRGFHVADSSEANFHKEDGPLPAFIWETGIVRIQLRECKERGTFCLETVVRLRVRERQSGRTVYDEFALYSHPTARPDPFSEQPFRYARLPAHRTYETPLPTPASCRKLKFYCAEHAATLLQQELRQV
ncbi:MAG: hypothetical protein D6690_00710, partial [Nitrospirae bacterium]